MQIAKRPNRITQREAAAAWNVGAPLEMELKTVKPKRQVNRNAETEWKLQAVCVKALRARMLVDRDLNYEVNMSENYRSPARANIAKLMGLKAGPNDITLYRKNSGMMQTPTGLVLKPNGFTTLRIEFKLPGNHLTDAQLAWFHYWRSAGVRCERVDNLEDFLNLLNGF